MNKIHREIIFGIPMKTVAAKALIERKWSSAGRQQGPGEERKREDIIRDSICGGWDKTRRETHLSLTFTFLCLMTPVLVSVCVVRWQIKNWQIVMCGKLLRAECVQTFILGFQLEYVAYLTFCTFLCWHKSYV